MNVVVDMIISHIDIVAQMEHFKALKPPHWRMLDYGPKSKNPIGVF